MNWCYCESENAPQFFFFLISFLYIYIYLNRFPYAFYAVHLMMETSIRWALYYDANTSYLMPHADWLEQKIRATCRIRSKQILELSAYTKFTVV